jgi:hypothetical protein
LRGFESPQYYLEGNAVKRLLEDFLEFLLTTLGGILLLSLLMVLVFLAIFWPQPQREPLPWVGIMGRDIDAKTVQQCRLPFSMGVLVERVFSNSPADISNLAPGDCIVKFNNRNLFGEAQMRDMIFELDPNETAWMTVYRDGSYYNVMLRLGAKPTEHSLPAQAVAFAPGGGAGMTFGGGGSATNPPLVGTGPPITADANLPHSYRGVCSNCHVIVSRLQASQPNTQLVAALRNTRNSWGLTQTAPNAPTTTGWPGLPGQNLPGAGRAVPLEEFFWAGIAVEGFSPAAAGALGLPPNVTGVLVDDVLLGSLGDRGGVRAGDLIREINGFAIYDADSFANVVNAQKLTGGVLLVNRNGRSIYLTVPEA